MPIPEIDSVLLSATELKDLERSYQNVHGDDMQEVSMPEMTSKPGFQRSLGPSKFVQHGKTTKRFVSMIGAMRNVSEFTVDRWEQIYDDEGPISVQRASVAGRSPAPSLASSVTSLFTLMEEQPGPKDLRSPKKPAKGTKAQRGRPASSFSEDLSDTAGSSEDEDEDDNDDLDGFVVQDKEPLYRRHTASTLSSSPPPDFPPAKTKPFFEPTQFTATQGTNDDDDAMPDLSDLLGSRNAQPLWSPLMQNRIHGKLESGRGRRGRRRRILDEEDSDE
jgi:hypothetical protein